jgi:putative ABC transport system permease protein
MLHDFQITVRQLLRRPGFSLAMIATLMLGIGANSAIFSLLNAVLLKPLPYPQPDRMVGIWGHLSKPDIPRLQASEGEVLDYQHNFQSFEAVAAYAASNANLTAGDEPERVRIYYATSEIWKVVGVQPLIGRGFTADEDKPGAPAVVVLSHGLWRRRFGEDRSLVGRTIQVNLTPRTVVGIMPPGFDFPGRADVWAPLALDPANLLWRQEHYLNVVARLKPGVTIAQARADLRAQTSRWPQVYAPTYSLDGGWDTDVISLLDQEVGDVRPYLFLLLGAVGLVLLITCANIGSMLLVRVESRAREILVRSALGAGRGSLIRQFALESLLLALVGGMLGLLVASWAVRAVVLRYPDAIPRSGGVELDWRVVAFTLAVTLFTGFLVSLLPAWYGTRPDLSQALKESGASATGSAAKLRSQRALVVIEVAFAITLLIGAGLLIRSFFRLRQEAVGFSPEKVVTMQLYLPRSRYSQPAQVAGFFAELDRRLKADASVAAAGVISHLPLGGEPNPTGTITAEGRPTVAGRPQPEPATRSISPGYFAALNIPVRTGRAFTDSDDAQAPLVAIVDQRLAANLWPGQVPLGRRVRLGPPDVPPELLPDFPWRTVVGVVGNVRDGGPSVPPSNEGIVYLPIAQRPENAVYLALRTKLADPAALAGTVRQQVRAVDRDEPIADVATMEERLARVLTRPRLTAVLLASFGGLALVLAVIGIYAVISQTVSRRTREIGIRMALGADRTSIVGLMARRGLALVALGVGFGLALSLLTALVVSRVFYGVHASDPMTFAAVALLLSAVALLAVLWPARRASQLQPMTAFRQE